MARRRLLICGAIILVAGLVVAWCGANISADFADLGSSAIQRGDDGSLPALVVLVAGAAIAMTGLVVLGSARTAPTTPKRQ